MTSPNTLIPLAFASSLAHIQAELARIGLLIQIGIRWARAAQPAHPNDLPGLYITEEEIDALLIRPAGPPPKTDEEQSALARLSAQIAQAKAHSLRQGVALRLEELARHFDLAAFDVDALLIGLAPELDRRYERLYAYLHDDVTKKRPSVDLVLNLLSDSFEDKLNARRRFAPNQPLVQHRLIELIEDPAQPKATLLNQFVKVDERIVRFLLEEDDDSDICVDARLADCVTLVKPVLTLDDLILPVDFKQRLVNAAEPGAILYFQGDPGVGKQSTAEALVQRTGQTLLVIETERLMQQGGPRFVELVRLAAREARLQNSLLYWAGFDTLLTQEVGEAAAHGRIQRRAVLQTLREYGRLCILAGETTWPADALDSAQDVVQFEFASPDYAARSQLWSRALRQRALMQRARGAGREVVATLQPDDVQRLTSMFRFTGGQIYSAVQSACDQVRLKGAGDGIVQVTSDDLQAACRQQSRRGLAQLAQLVVPHYTWRDIVVPAGLLQHLRDICNTAIHRNTIYGTWGFDRKLSLGKGLNVLFAGASGTGKTMAAEVIANDLGLDLYKIDLSGIVSKYIGETEKNLNRIFKEAETSNAILFFDEADALFGKRSEVRDAHDRYANIEVGYLLQKMEEYTGTAILATNFRRNMDDAFVRRMHFTVEFPVPNEADRRRIWHGIWPTELPRRADLDFDFMARRFEIAGGHIRNIALGAAFLAAAASDEHGIGMAHLVQATQREYQKMGKVVLPAEFEEYARYLDSAQFK